MKNKEKRNLPILSFFDTSNITREVTSSKEIFRGKFHPEGLYSEQIFGPSGDYTCQCGIYDNMSGGRCKKCGVEYTLSMNRSFTIAKIALPYPVIDQIFLDCMNTSRRNLSEFDKLTNQLLEFETYLVLPTAGQTPEYEIMQLLYSDKNDNEEELLINTPYRKYGSVAVKKLIELLLMDENTRKMVPKRLRDLFQKFSDQFLLDSVLVLPPELRPIIVSNGKTVITDEINKMYGKILRKIEIIKGNKYLNTLNELTIRSYKLLQKLVSDTYKEIFKIFGGKRGIIRGNMLGKRIDLSARAVITPDPTLKFNQCRVSYYILLEVYKFHVARKVSKDTGEMFATVIKDIERCLKEKDLKYYNEVQQVTDGIVANLNRQPTLHNHGLQGFYVLCTPDPTIKIHPMVCSAFNADFDGDQMAIYFFFTNEAIEDVKENMLIDKRLFMPGDGSLAVVPNQDIIYGIYLLSKDPKQRNLLPKPLLQYMVQKNLTSIKKKELIDFLEKYIRETSNVDILDEIKDLGLITASKSDLTMSLKDLINSYVTKEERVNLYKYHTNMVKFLEEEERLVNEVLKVRCSFSELIDCQARGSWNQAKQMFLCRGLISNAGGEIQKVPILSNFIDGLNPKEMFLSCNGVRKGLVDVADNTAKSGSFGRQLVYLGIGVELEDSKTCCTTDKFLPMFIKDEKMAKSIIDRFYFPTPQDALKNNMKRITHDNWHEFIGKTVLLKSIIFCTHPKVCWHCAPIVETLKEGHNINIGIISGQSLQERATQLVLRSFHDSGSATKKSKTDSTQQEDIVGDLVSVERMFTKPKDYGLNKLENIAKFVLRLYDIYKPHGNLRMIHFELLTSCLMWTYQDDDFESYSKTKLVDANLVPWRTKQNRPILPLSINKVPENYSWLVSAACGHFKSRIIKGIGNPIGTSLFDRIIIGNI